MWATTCSISRCSRGSRECRSSPTIRSIQTLPYYASGFWLALVGMAPGDGGFPLLLAMGFASRFLAFVAFLACADAMGIRDLIGRLLFVVLIAFSSMMNGLSAAGEGGLFINYFTHSELANATNLLAIWCAARGRFTEAFACNGVTFFLNAFMAVWNAVPLGLIAILLLMRREIGWRTLLWRSALGLIAFLILAAPVIHAITANPEFGRPIDFDYPTFLTEYYPVPLPGRPVGAAAGAVAGGYYAVRSRRSARAGPPRAAGRILPCGTHRLHPGLADRCGAAVR